MPSKLDPHIALIEDWLAAEPQLTAIAIVGRLADLHPDQFGKKQHSIVQRVPARCERGKKRVRRFLRTGLPQLIVVNR